MDDALLIYERIWEIGTTHPSIWYHYAAVLAQSGETEKSRELLERVLASSVVFDEREAAQALLDSF